MSELGTSDLSKEDYEAYALRVSLATGRRPHSADYISWLFSSWKRALAVAVRRGRESGSS